MHVRVRAKIQRIRTQQERGNKIGPEHFIASNVLRELNGAREDKDGVIDKTCRVKASP